MPKKSAAIPSSDDSKVDNASDQDVMAAQPAAADPSERYTVVARRYRPRSFDQLIGQQTVAKALQTAIASDRVGHAYLFTGARGVGKTSTARIFAKALNTAGEDASSLIERGEDIDVIEIDGASNRGIDEMRSLRSNASVRPSRSRYKIYIIDEVHMLTLQAFNALLKTLEEPPEHVKFILCTTDPDKVPITVRSRCQRFDFPPIRIEDIQSRLSDICDTEGVAAEPDALRLIARRANGSMRDSQSLLEQLLSFSPGNLSTEAVHSLLGTADDTILNEICEHLSQGDAAGALSLFNRVTEEGVDAGQFAEQLLGYLRDLLAVAVGGDADILRTANPQDLDVIRALVGRWGTQTILAAASVIDETLVRMRHSLQSRILLDIALVQIAYLGDLQAIADLAAAVRDGTALPPLSPGGRATAVGRSSAPQPSADTRPAEKKKLETSAEFVNASRGTSDGASAAAVDRHAAGAPSLVTPPSVPKTITTTAALDSQAALEYWRTATAECEGMLADICAMVVDIRLDGQGAWVVQLPAGSELMMQMLQEPVNLQQLLVAVERTTGRKELLRFALSDKPVAVATQQPKTGKSSVSQQQLFQQAAADPFVSSLIESLQAEIVRVDPPVDAT